MSWLNESDWLKTRETYTAFWNGDLDRPLVSAYGPKDSSYGSGSFHTPYSPDDSAEEIILKAEKTIDNTICYGDAFPCFWPNFGPGLTAAMTDICDLHHLGGTIWFEPKEIKGIQKLKVEVNLANKWFQKIKEVTSLAVKKFGFRAQVAFTDLGGNLDLLSACRTANNLLMDLIDFPDDVKRVTAEFHDAWWVYFNELSEIIKKQLIGFTPWALTWAPERTYIMQCDFASMISPDMFMEFAIPEIRRTCSKLEYSFFHLDGPGMAAHIKHLLDIDELKGIQWQPGTGAPSGDTWTDLIPQILEAGKLVQLITNREQTLNAIKNFGRKNIMYLVTESLQPEQGKEFIKNIGI